MLSLLSTQESTGSQPNKKQLSAAMQRHVVDDSHNELYSRFNYTPVTGLGYEEGVSRRDPSSIIKVDGLYYVWYTRCLDTKSTWLNADIWYATSPDGINWTEQGPAVERGPDGSWDDYSVFTTNILVADGKYYMTYQAEKKDGYGINAIGMAKADSPAGPWQKLPEPILTVGSGGKWKPDPKRPGKRIDLERGEWDSAAIHDPGVIPRWGKYWLYYKAHGLGDHMPADSKWGVAVADHPEGPYVKAP